MSGSAAASDNGKFGNGCMYVYLISTTYYTYLSVPAEKANLNEILTIAGAGALRLGIGG